MNTLKIVVIALLILFLPVCPGRWFASESQETPPPQDEEPAIQTPPETVIESKAATTTETIIETEYPETGNSICTSDCPLIDPNNPPSGEVETMVLQAFETAPVLVNIAYCESNFIQYGPDGLPLKNPNSTATGVMQIMKSVHGQTAESLGLDIDTLAGNLAYARYLYDEKGTKPWEASRHCWEVLPVYSPAKHLATSPGTSTM